MASTRQICGRAPSSRPTTKTDPVAAGPHSAAVDPAAVRCAADVQQGCLFLSRAERDHRARTRPVPSRSRRRTRGRQRADPDGAQHLARHTGALRSAVSVDRPRHHLVDRREHRVRDLSPSHSRACGDRPDRLGATPARASMRRRGSQRALAGSSQPPAALSPRRRHPQRSHDDRVDARRNGIGSPRRFAALPCGCSCPGWRLSHWRPRSRFQRCWHWDSSAWHSRVDGVDHFGRY